MGTRDATQRGRWTRRRIDGWATDRGRRAKARSVSHLLRRTTGFRSSAAVAASAAAVLLTGCLGPVTRLEALPAGQLPETSDPSVVRVGGTYHVYGSNNHLRAPVFTTDDLARSYTLGEKNSRTVEGMPTKPPWAASGTQLWAPSVAQFGARWVMFFSADRLNPPQPQQPAVHRSRLGGRPDRALRAGGRTPALRARGNRGRTRSRGHLDKWGNPFLLAAFGDTESPLHSVPLDADGEPRRGPGSRSCVGSTRGSTTSSSSRR